MKRFSNGLRRAQPCLIALFFLLLPSLARGHVTVGESHGFDHGFGHPLSGIDHICAMVAVGLWAAQQRGRAVWVLPLSFVALMTLGAVLGAVAVSVPFVENGIVLSVVALGVLVAASARLPLFQSVVLVGLFALFHGHAHGAELPANASGLAYGAGFIVATALLHALGVGIATFMARPARMKFVRIAGAAIAFCGVSFWLA